MENRYLRLISISLFIITLMLSGCGRSSPSRYYILSALRDAGKPQAAGDAGSSIAIGVGPVTVPDYLNRPQIVSRGGQNELIVANFSRWGEPLQQNVAGVIAENLSSLIPTDRVYVYPWMPNISIDYSVTVDIIRLDGVLGENVSLSARWVVTGDGLKEVLEKGASQHTEQTGGEGYADFVAAQSRLLEQLSRDIAESINKISTKPAASK